MLVAEVAPLRGAGQAPLMDRLPAFMADFRFNG